MPNARIGMSPADALELFDSEIAKAAERFGPAGHCCLKLPEARAISAAFHRLIDERPTHTPEVPI